MQKHTVAIILIACLVGCQPECQINCPARCVPIEFTLSLNGTNILRDPTPFLIENMSVETIPVYPEAPPILGKNNENFKLVVCEDVEYMLNLNDTLSVEITAKLDTFWVDPCCTYFAAYSIKFNGNEICPNPDDCGGGTFNLN